MTAGYIAKYLFQLKCWYYKKKFRDCGKNLSVYGRPRVIHGENIILGNHVNLNDGALLNATSSKIIIGDNVTVSSDAKIIAASYSREEFMMKGQRTHIPGGGDFNWKQRLDLCWCNDSSWNTNYRRICDLRSRFSHNKKYHTRLQRICWKSGKADFE